MQTRKSTYDILVNYLTSNAKKTENDLELERWMEDVILSNEYDFEFGIVGMGWLIAYLIQNNYLQVDQDEILEDLDDNIHKITLRTVATENVSLKELLYLCTYYQQRLLYESKAHFYRRFSLFECLKLLIDKLCVCLKNETSQHLLDTRVDILLKFSSLSKECVGDVLFEDSFYPAFESCIKTLRTQEACDPIMLYKLGIAAKQYDNPFWIDSIQEIVTNNATAENHQQTKPSEIWRCVYERYPNPYISFSNDYLIQQLDKKELFDIITNVYYIKTDSHASDNS